MKMLACKKKFPSKRYFFYKKINTTRLIVLFKFNFQKTDCKRNFVTVIDRSITSYAHLQTKKIAFFFKKKLPFKKKMASIETNLVSHSFQKKKKKLFQEKFQHTIKHNLFFFFFFNISRFDHSSMGRTSDPMKNDRIEVNISRGVVNER